MKTKAGILLFAPLPQTKSHRRRFFGWQKREPWVKTS